MCCRMWRYDNALILVACRVGLLKEFGDVKIKDAG